MKTARTAGISIGVLVLTVCLVEEVVGRHRWRQAQAHVAAVGESLLPAGPEPAVPVDEDFGCAPVVVDVLRRGVPRDLAEHPERHEPLVRDLIAAAKARPRADLSGAVRATGGNLKGTIVCIPRSSPVFDLRNAAWAMAGAAAKAGDGARSLDLLRVLWRINDGLNRPRGVVRLMPFDEMFRDGVARHTWTEAMLGELESRARSMDFAGETLAQSRAAVSGWSGYCDRFVNDRAAGLREWEGDASSETWEQLLGWLLPTGSLRHGQASCVSSLIDDAVVPLRGGGLLAWYRHERDRAAPRPGTLVRGHFVAIALWPDHVRARRLLEDEVKNRQLLIACEMERHFLRHGRYPAALAELPGPLPPDLDGQPMRHSSTPDGGRYDLWSVGPDVDRTAAPAPMRGWTWEVPW